MSLSHAAWTGNLPLTARWGSGEFERFRSPNPIKFGIRDAVVERIENSCRICYFYTP